MAHDDRTREGPLDNTNEWRRCNWFTHPLFKSLMDVPDPKQVEKLLLGNSWGNAEPSMWALRSAFANIDHPGMREVLVDAFSANRIPTENLTIWPHGHLRSRFVKEEISGPCPPDLLACLARHWTWFWEEEASSQGMGESHPVSRLVRAGREDILDHLYGRMDPQQWLDWQSAAADKMVSLIVRKASAAGLSALLFHDCTMLDWRRGKGGRSLLHEACLKLRDDMVEVLLDSGMDASARTQGGETPAMLALAAVINQTSPRQKSVLRQNAVMDRLDHMLHLLGAKGGLEDGAPEMMEELRRERFDRMRMIVERALLSAAPSDVLLFGDVRRL